MIRLFHVELEFASGWSVKYDTVDADTAAEAALTCLAAAERNHPNCGTVISMYVSHS